MSKTIEVQCGQCRKRFRLREDQLNRAVRCPHCKTVVRIQGQPSAGAGPARAPRESAAASRTRGRPARAGAERPLTRKSPAVPGGVRNRSVAIVWAVLLGVALVVVVAGLVTVFGDRGFAPSDAVGQAGPPPGGAADETTSRPSAGAGAEGGAGGGSGANAGGGTAADTALKPGQEWEPPPPSIAADIERVLRGYHDETVTYAVGRVTNNTDEMIPALRVVVELYLTKDGEKVGDATGVILNLPPKHTAPVVAECRHDPGVRAKAWMLAECVSNPTGVPRELPPLETVDATPVADPNSVAPTGLVRARVRNHGDVPVEDMLVTALLIDKKGKIVGAARNVASKQIEPGATGEVEIEWRHCAGTLVRDVEAWVQPRFYEQK